MNNNVYLTKDLYEASLLYVNHLKLVRLEREDSYWWFVFEDKAKAERLSALFWQREIEVNAKLYAEGIRSLKDRLFSRKD